MTNKKYPSTMIIVIGIAFIGWGLFTYYSYLNFIDNSKSTTATITLMSSGFKTTVTNVTYTVDNKQIESTLDYKPDNLLIGDKIIVYYNQSDPKQIEGGNKSILNVGVIYGLVIVGLGFITLIINKVVVKIQK